MAALTTVDRLMADNGVSDPKIAFPGLVSLAKSINFADVTTATSGSDSGKKVKASVNYDLLDIPEGFVLERVLFKETESCASGTITLKTKSDSATIGSAVTVGGSTPAKAFLAPATVTAKDSAGTSTVTVSQSKTYASGDTLCFVSSVDRSYGGFEVILVGYLPDDADSRLTPARTQPWRMIGNKSRNVANADRLLGK